MPQTTARRSERQGTEAEALRLIEEAQFGHLATVCDDGFPYVVPVNHVLTGRTILIHSAVAGQKLDNIQKNPRVCFEVANMIELVTGPVPCAYGAKYESAVAFGRAAVVTNAPEKRRALELIARKFTGKEGPFEESEVARVSVISIQVESATCKARR